jgi:V-ATPase subunit C
MMIVVVCSCRIELSTGLMVGTLDSLMSLSDELVRVDSLVENVVRKVSNNSIVQYKQLPIFAVLQSLSLCAASGSRMLC